MKKIKNKKNMAKKKIIKTTRIETQHTYKQSILLSK